MKVKEINFCKLWCAKAKKLYCVLNSSGVRRVARWWWMTRHNYAPLYRLCALSMLTTWSLGRCFTGILESTIDHLARMCMGSFQSWSHRIRERRNREKCSGIVGGISLKVYGNSSPVWARKSSSNRMTRVIVILSFIWTPTTALQNTLRLPQHPTASRSQQPTTTQQHRWWQKSAPHHRRVTGKNSII